MRPSILIFSILSLSIAGCAPTPARQQAVACADVIWKSGVVVHRVCSKNSQIQVIELHADDPELSRELSSRSAAFATDQMAKERIPAK